MFVHSFLLTAHIATDTDERKKFVQTYLSSSGNLMFIVHPYWFLGIRLYQFWKINYLLDSLQSLPGEESEVEVENLIKSIEKYTLASHLVWGLWGIISVGLLMQFSLFVLPTNQNSMHVRHSFIHRNLTSSGCRTMSTISTLTIRNTRGRGSSSTG